MQNLQYIHCIQTSQLKSIRFKSSDLILIRCVSVCLQAADLHTC